MLTASLTRGKMRQQQPNQRAEIPGERRIEDEARLACVPCRGVGPVWMQRAVADLGGGLKPAEEMKVEVVPAGAAMHDERMHEEERQPSNENDDASTIGDGWSVLNIRSHPAGIVHGRVRRALSSAGVSISVCVMVGWVAAGINGAAHRCGPRASPGTGPCTNSLAGLPDSPRTMFSVVRSGPLRSVVNRSDGAKAVARDHALRSCRRRSGAGDRSRFGHPMSQRASQCAEAGEQRDVQCRLGEAPCRAATYSGRCGAFAHPSDRVGRRRRENRSS